MQASRNASDTMSRHVSAQFESALCVKAAIAAAKHRQPGAPNSYIKMTTCLPQLHAQCTALCSYKRRILRLNKACMRVT